MSANDQIHVYVDFILIVSTTSPDDALGLLIAMYNVFELNFNKHSRAIRFLYSIFHNDKRFLSNAMRLLIKEKNIDVFNEQNQQQAVSLNGLGHRAEMTNNSNNSNTINQTTESISIDKNIEIDSLGQINTHSSNNNLDSKISQISSEEW